VFSTRETKAIVGARALIARIGDRSSEDLLRERLDELSDVIEEQAGNDERQLWLLEISPLP